MNTNLNASLITSRYRLLILLLLTSLLSGCISSLLKEPIPTFSKQINFTPPASPFEKIKSTSYPSWKNSDSQNVILIISSCDEAQAPLTTAYQAISENIDDVKVEASKLDQIKIKKHFSKQIHGLIDGDPVEVQTISFQYKNCTYLSALSGKPATVSKDVPAWKNFLNSIEFIK